MGALDNIVGDPIDPMTAGIELVSGGLAPDEQADLPVQYAAIGSIRKEDAEGKNPRTQLYEALQQQGSKLADAKADLITKMQTGEGMTKSQVAAMMLIGLLPTLVGGALKGKKGIAKGAEAGALGATTMAKGIEANRKEEKELNKLQLNALDDAISKNQDLQAKNMLEGVSAQESAVQKELDRQTTLGAASIRSGGDIAVGKGLRNLAQEMTNERLSREGANTKAGIALDDKRYLVPTKSVKEDTADKMHEYGYYYNTALDNLQSIIEQSKGMQVQTLQSAIGNQSTDIGQKFTMARNAVMAAKKIPGLKGTEALADMDNFISSPANFIRQVIGNLPGTATVTGELSNAFKNLRQDYARLAKFNHFEQFEIDQPVIVNGKQGIFKGLDESGSPIVAFKKGS